MNAEATAKIKDKKVLIYALGEKCAIGRHVICCMPGATAEGKEVSDWRDVEGKPYTMQVTFNNGVAEVGPQLATFLTNPERKLASKSRPVLAMA